MTLPGILLALELSGQHDEELARRLQRREAAAMADLYDRFGCPGGHIQATFRCLVAQGADVLVDPKARDQTNAHHALGSTRT